MGNPNGGLRHGHKRGGIASPTYRIWIGVKRRCHDVGCKDFPHYGGAGITICERWDSSFPAFLADMGERPTLDHTIDRMNPAGNYEPSNCRWVPRAVQTAENKRTLRPVTIDGVTYHSIRAACRVFGVSPTTVNMRLKDGHPLELAVSAPLRGLPKCRTRESYLRKTHPDRI